MDWSKLSDNVKILVVEDFDLCSKEHRFQKMKKTHPKQYNYCINKLGCGKVLDFIGIKYN